MKYPIKFKLVLLAVLPAIVLLALAGCSGDPVDGQLYNPSGWEKLMKDPTLRKADFTRLYALATSAQFRGCQVFVTGKLQITMKLFDGGELKVPLDAVWTETLKDPANRPATCRRHIAELAASKAASGALAARVNSSTILPVIWSGLPPESGSGSMVHNSTANNQEPIIIMRHTISISHTNQFVTEPLAADIYILYFGNRDGHDVYLTEDDCKLLHLDLPALHKLAVTNLTDLLPGITHREPEPPFTIIAGGRYAASQLLADKLWDKEASAVRGELIAAVPSCKALIFTGSASPGGVEALRRKVQQVYGGSRDDVISTTLLVRRNGKWEVFKD
jgi:hypothetical protein